MKVVSCVQGELLFMVGLYDKISRGLRDFDLPWIENIYDLFYNNITFILFLTYFLSSLYSFIFYFSLIKHL